GPPSPGRPPPGTRFAPLEPFPTRLTPGPGLVMHPQTIPAAARLAEACTDLHFRHLLETLPAGAYTCDPDGLITYFNAHAARLWGRAPKLNDPIDRFCGSFKLFATDGSPIRHDQCWMARALHTGDEY